MAARPEDELPQGTASSKRAPHIALVQVLGKEVGRDRMVAEALEGEASCAHGRTVALWNRLDGEKTLVLELRQQTAFEPASGRDDGVEVSGCGNGLDVAATGFEKQPDECRYGSPNDILVRIELHSTTDGLGQCAGVELEDRGNALQTSRNLGSSACVECVANCLEKQGIVELGQHARCARADDAPHVEIPVRGFSAVACEAFVFDREKFVAGKCRRNDMGNVGGATRQHDTEPRKRFEVLEEGSETFRPHVNAMAFVQRIDAQESIHACGLRRGVEGAEEVPELLGWRPVQ